MKSFFLTLAFVFAIQLSNAQKLYIGPRIGANLSQLHGLNYAMPRAGWDLGAFLVFNPCQRTGFSADILFSSNGSRSKHSNESGPLKETWDAYLNMNYLKIPILYHLYLNGENCIFRPKIFAGFSTGLLLSSRQSLSYSLENNSTKLDSSSDKSNCGEFKKIDVGGIAGLGFVYKMAENAELNFDVRYQNGFQDIRSQRSSFSAPLHHKNISFLFGIAYLLK